MESSMRGALLPGGRRVEMKEFPVPEPGFGQVLVQMKASTICGSDIRAIYREHLGHGPEGYQDVICGHEPCGRIVRTGPGMKRLKNGDRVTIYHISGCGECLDCRMGYMISCTSPLRAAYGWQRDGGMADFLLADEKDCVVLPANLTYLDGANIACGFGTAWEALTRIGVSGRDRLLVTGLGPVGLAVIMLARSLGVRYVIGVDTVEERRLLASDLKLIDVALPAGSHAAEEISKATNSDGCQAAVDCSGSPDGRLTAIRGSARWGRVAFVGEGGSVQFEPSPDIIHKQITIFGSWVTSIGHMQDLVSHLSRLELHPEAIITHRFPLDAVKDGFSVMDEGKCGKVAVVFD